MKSALTIIVVLMTTASYAETQPTEALTKTFMTLYTDAWESRNPFVLVDLAAPNSTPFDELLKQSRFDALHQTSVKLTDVKFVRLSEDRVQIEFQKDQEDVFLDGTVTQGVAKIKIVTREILSGPLGAQSKVLRIESHDVIPAVPEENAHNETFSLAQSHFFAAMTLIRKSAFEQALSHLDKALAAKDSVKLRTGAHRFIAQIHYFRATCLARTNELKSAVGALQKATELNEEFPLALNQLAETRLAAGELMPALDLLRRSLEVNPDQPDVQELLDFVGRALTHMRTDEQRFAYLSLRNELPRRALKTARKYMLRDPKNQEWRRLVAVFLIETNQPDDANAILEINLAGQLDPSVLYLKARSAMARGKTLAALKQFEQLWQQSPNYKDSLVYITELNGKSQRWRAAINILKEALRLKPRAPEIHFKLGVYTLRLGRRFEALTYLQQARALRPPTRIRPALHKLLQQL